MPSFSFLSFALLLVSVQCQGGWNVVSVAGNWTLGAQQQLYNGNSLPALNTAMSTPFGVALDAIGNIYYSDTLNGLVRKLDVITQRVTTVIGNISYAQQFNPYTGNGLPALLTAIATPTGVALDSAGNLLYIDNGNALIRKLNVSSGSVSTIIGNISLKQQNILYNGDGPALNTALSSPYCLALDSSGNIFFSDIGTSLIRKLNVSTGLVVTVAGNYTLSQNLQFNGDGPALNTALSSPSGLTVDASGNIYFADQFQCLIRKVDAFAQRVTTVAGNYSLKQQNTFYNGDGLFALNTAIYFPYGVALDASGNLVYSDSYNSLVRKIDMTTQRVTTVAGNYSLKQQQVLFNGDNVVALNAALNYPSPIAIDATGSIVFGDTYNYLIRRLRFDSPSSTGTVTQTQTPSQSQTQSLTRTQTATSTVSQSATLTRTSTQTPSSTQSPVGTPAAQGLTSGQQGAIAGGVVGGVMIVVGVVVASVVLGGTAATKNKETSQTFEPNQLQPVAAAV
jgi:trimeric autotransporter adhesin